jgi:DNA-binding beta-propeller fold protein YncE
VASYFSDAITVFGRKAANGALVQLPGKTGRVSETGSGGACKDGKGLNGPNGVAVAPDGTRVYAVSWYSSAVLAFERFPLGALSLLVCTSETGSGGECADGQ